MADKGWAAQVATAAGVAAGIGAAQLGLGYGLGVVVWPTTALPDDSVWLGSLGWATWIAASSTVFGAVIASRLRSAPLPAPEPARLDPAGVGTAAQHAGSRPAGPADRPAERPGPARRPAGPWRFALSTAAAIGALLTVALIALPARSAVRADTFSPETVAGGYALAGVVLGLAVAYWAVVSRPAAANLIATASWLWALAVASIVVELTTHRSSATYLTSWQFADPDNAAPYGNIYWPSSVLTLLAAVLIGIIAAWPAVRRGDFGIGAASSGAVGPLLVAAAFFVLAPQLTGALGPLESAYLVAPYAVLAGLAGSAFTVGVGKRAAERDSGRRGSTRDRRPAKADRRSEPRPVGGADGAARSPDPSAKGGRRARAGSHPATAADLKTPSTPETENAANATDAPAKTSRRRRFFGRRGRDTGTESPGANASDRSLEAERVSAPSSAAGPVQSGAGPEAAGSAPTSPRSRLDTESTAQLPQAGSAPTKNTQAPPSAAPPVQRVPQAAAPISPPQPTTEPPRSDSTPRDRANVVQPSATPPRPQTRSTVAPPPASPPIAQINGPRPGEEPSARTARPGAADPAVPGQIAPEKAASAKARPAKVTPAKVTPAKVTPANRAPSKPAPSKAAPAKMAPSKAAPSKAAPGRAAPGRPTPADPTPGATPAGDSDQSSGPTNRHSED